MTRLKQFAPKFGRFALVGLSGTLVNLALLWLLASAGMPRLLAALVATELSIINNFVWNDAWTFGQQASQRSRLARFLRFQCIASFTAVLTLGLFALFSDYLHIYYLLAQFIAIGVATLLNFVANSRLTWGEQAALDFELPFQPASFAIPPTLAIKEVEE
jgi:dolichol-phosphate mannosyltransferase